MDNLDNLDDGSDEMFDDADDIDIDDTIFEKPQQTTFTEEEYNKMAKMMMEMNMRGKNSQQKQPSGNAWKMRETSNLVENMKKYNRQRFSNATSSSSSQPEKLAEENMEVEKEEVVVEDVDVVIDSMCELEFTE
jgi:hypothetical protein